MTILTITLVSLQIKNIWGEWQWNAERGKGGGNLKVETALDLVNRFVYI